MTIIKLHIFACEQILHKQIKKRVKNWRKYSVKLHIKPVHAFMKINNNFLSTTLITTFASSFRKNSSWLLWAIISWCILLIISAYRKPRSLKSYFHNLGQQKLDCSLNNWAMFFFSIPVLLDALAFPVGPLVLHHPVMKDKLNCSNVKLHL